MLKSVSFFKVLIAAEENIYLALNGMCKACFQKVEKVLKLESSISSVLSMLKAGIQALALTATTQNIVCSVSEESKYGQSTILSAFKASSVGR